MMPGTCFTDPVKKSIACFFLVIFLYKTMGNYMVFEIDKYLAKQQMKAFLCAHKEHVLILTFRFFQPERDPDFQRIESREFIYKGRLYDILDETVQQGITVIHCVHDLKEELLCKTFAEVQHGKVTLALLHHLITQALPVDPQPSATYPGTEIRYPGYFSHFLPVYMATNPHPPEAG